MKTYLTSAALLCQFTAFSQANFQEGFIITQQKDTLTGFIALLPEAVSGGTYVSNIRWQSKSDTVGE